MIHCSDSMPVANLLKSTIILSNNNKNNKYNLNIMISSISMWFERWFLSSNAKDIGVLYLIYALFSGLVGTAFSVLIRLELSGPGVQFIADNQLYNSIITAHAIIMSAPLSCGEWLVLIELTNESSCVKNYQGGGAELHGETRTPKLIVKGVDGINIRILGNTPDLNHETSRLTNLIKRINLHNWNSTKWIDRVDALFTLILSLVLKLLSINNGLPRKEDKHCARDLSWCAIPGNCGITYGNPRLGVPKNRTKNSGPIMGGDGVVVVGISGRRATVSNLHVRTLTSKAGSNATRGSEVEKTHNSIEVNIKVISNYKNLVSAYELIKSNPGNMTKGVKNETLDGMNRGYLENVQRKLKAGTYQFNPARRIQIPKPGKNETRPLTIASPREKIVQKAIQLVMERLYEPIFLSSSHGFRPGRGTHTAMKQLESQFQSVRYVIEANFSKAFDSIHHDTLMNIIKERVKCEKTLKLIKSSLKAGFIEFGELHNNLTAGTPQGSILSPLLCNIFLHQLDEFIEGLKVEYQKGTKRQRSAENTKLQNQAKYWRMKGYDKTRPTLYKAIIKQLLKSDSIKRDDSYIRVHYVRYADDFVMGIIGSHSLARMILERVEKFVKERLNLTFNADKTGIVDFSKNNFDFLGYSNKAASSKGKQKPIEKIKLGQKTITRRKKIRVSIEMDTSKVLKKLVENGFIRKRVSHSKHDELVYRGTSKGNLINLDHPDILKYYNSVLRGIQNYYSFARNRVSVARIGWLIKESCAMTLAKKFRLKTIAKVFRKFGKDLGYDVNKETRLSFADIAYTKATNIAKPGNTTQDPLKNIEKVWNAKFTKSKLGATCIICGSPESIEMHHVRQIRGLKNPNQKLDFYTRQMAAINRKQVPLCKFHHNGLHNDTWTNEERAAFNYETKRKRTNKPG